MVQKIEKIERRFNVEADFDVWHPNFNIGLGSLALIIASDAPNTLQMGSFGFHPNWDYKKLISNAREDKILTSVEWKSALANRRCLVIADCFYEGPEKEKLSKPFVVYLQDQERLFAFAGVFNDIEKNGQTIRSFAIVTTTPTKVIDLIGHHRSPVVLNPSDYNKWLSQNQDLFNYTDCLKNNINELQNAFPVSVEVKSIKNNDKSLVDPIGERLIPEYDYSVSNHIVLQGMGSTKKDPTK